MQSAGRVHVAGGIGKNGPMESSAREIAILGSTGSIGTQAADVIRRNPGKFRVTALAAGGGNLDLLASQAVEFGVEAVAVAQEGAVEAVTLALRAAAERAAAEGTAGSGSGRLPKVLAGPESMTEIAAWPCDTVLNGITGAAGLSATLAALDAGRTLALANKESLIIGGPPVCGR